MASKTIQRLQRFFGIKTQKSQRTHQSKPVPATTSRDDSRLDAVKLPSDVQKFYDYWVTNYDNYSSLRERHNRYRDLEFCVLNSGIVGFAHELYTDESITPDENNEIIQVNAKNKKFEKWIRNFFDQISINQKLMRAASDDLALYADHFWALGFNDEVGINDVTPLSVYQIAERLEFNATRVEHEMTSRKNSLTQMASQDDRIKSMVAAIQDSIKEKNYTEWYKNYLFGFKLDSGRVIPPWNIIHFRRYDSKNEFAPFGKPLFLKSIARFRQLKAMENLIAMLRAAKMPREVYNVQLDENMPESERWMKLNEAREEYYSFGGLDTGNEDEMDIGSAIWTANGLVDFSIKESRVQIDQLGDLDQIRDDLALTTGVPQGYYNPNKSFSGTSGQSLLQQYKPFARKVYHNQAAMLDGLVHLIKLQLAITEAFPIDEDFELTMTYPITEETRDGISNKNDSLRLAKDVIDNLGQAVGLDRDASLPRDVVKAVFSKLSFLSQDEVDEWIDSIPEKEEEEGGGGMWNSATPDKRKIIEKKLNEMKNLKEETVKAAYFKAKRDRNMVEGVLDNRHFMTSRNRTAEYEYMYKYVSPSRINKLDDSIELFSDEPLND